MEQFTLFFWYYCLRGWIRLGESYFLKDTALVDKSNDAFHHEDYVKNLKKIIEEHDPPFNIALIGKWGVGKSSIINLLKKELEGKPEVVTHEINAWKYENDSLKKAFLKNLWQTFNKDKDTSYLKLLAESLRETSMQAALEDKLLSPWQTVKGIFSLIMVFLTLFLVSTACILALLYIWDGIHALFTANTFIENARDTFQTFRNNIWVAIIIAPLYKILQDLIKSSMHTKMADVKLIKPVETADEYEELFKDAIAEYKREHRKFKKLVVIVDDLDRLSTKKVVAALDAIKAFVEINECIFIVTCDENILINAIEKEKLNNSTEIDGELFLDKLFHFRIPLPPIIENDMSDFAIKIARQEATGLVGLCEGQFEEIIDILIHAEVSTPRQVKKLLNTFSNNLLIAHSREAGSRKLEHQLLTGEDGRRFLAKLAVIQSDYHDVYISVGKDFSYLDDLLWFYQEGYLESAEIKPSIKMLFNHKEGSYKIKPIYEGLMNFLSRTQHITVENMAPFIYLAQDAIGLKAGDEKQRAIRKNLVSGNEKGIITLLNEEQNPENLVAAIIEEVKQSTQKDSSSVIKSGIQLINHVANQKKELANAISHKLTTIGTAQIRLWQVEQQNILDVYHAADNKIGIEKALLFVLEELFSKSEKWRTLQGKEMTKEDFVNEISNMLHLLLSSSSSLPTSVSDKIKKFLAAEHDEYTFFPFEEIRDLYQNNKELFWEYFGSSFFNQLVVDMQSVYDNIINHNIETFFEIAPKIRENHITEFIESLHVVIASSPKNKVLDIVGLLKPISETININSGLKIVNALIDYTFEDDDNKREIMTALQIIPFNVPINSEFAERLDNFILEHLPERNAVILKDIIDLLEHILSKENVDFGHFNNVFVYLTENILDTPVNDEILKRLSRYLTDTQRSNLFNNINPIVQFNSYNASLFERAYSLYGITRKDSINTPFLQEVMRQGITVFQNNHWRVNPSWANDFVKLFSILAEKLEETDIMNFIEALYNYVMHQPDLVIKSFMYIGRYMPESKVIQAIEFAMNNANSETSKMEALEFIKSCNKYISSENNNLGQYVDYLIENFPIKVESFLNELNSEFESISDTSLIKLIKKSVNLNEQIFQANLKIIQRVAGKFFWAIENNEIKCDVLDQLIHEGIVAEDIDILLFYNSEKNVVALVLNRLIESDYEMNRDYKKELLKLCIPYHSSMDKASMTNLIVDVFRDDDDHYIIEICNILLEQYTNFRFGHEKKHIASQIVPTFRNVNMEAKEKVLTVAKMFSMEKEFENAIKEKLLSDEEMELVFKILAFRRGRFFNTKIK